MRDALDITIAVALAMLATAFAWPLHVWADLLEE